MSYLLDSNILIDALNQVPSAVEFVEQHARLGIFISTITAMEVSHGLYREGTNAQARLDDFLRMTPALEVNLPIALRCGELRAQLGRQGKSTRTRTLDLLIACTAIHHELTLVTENVKDFQDIPGLSLRQ
jgi:predicted nucleic acid-binding protein